MGTTASDPGSARYNRTRNFEACDHARSKKTQKFILRSLLRPNQISFSHNLDPKRTSQLRRLLSAWSATVVLSDKRAPAIDVEDIAGRVGVLHEIHVGGGEFIRLADARHG